MGGSRNISGRTRPLAHMIPLRLKATAPAATAPFVVRLRAAAAVIGSPPRLHEDADLASVGKSAAIYRTYAGELHIEGIEPNDTDGDVLLVVPEQRIAHRLIRARSQHNTLLVTERCDQLCVMCSQPRNLATSTTLITSQRQCFSRRRMR